MILISCLTSEEEKELARILTLGSIKFIIYKNESKIKTLNKLGDLFKFANFLRKNKVTLILGSPCSRNRYLSRLFSISFYCYMRSLHPLPDVLTSKSDLLFFYLKKIGLGFNVFNPYFADKIFVTSLINKSFLLSRNINSNTIYDVGAIWLDNIDVKESDEIRLIYISQAFKEHRHLEANNEQQETIIFLKKFCDLNNIQFQIKQHPRDYTDYNQLVDVSSFKELPTDFLKQVRKSDIFIGSFSTLAIEAMSLGIKYVPLEFKSLPNMQKVFSAQNMSTIKKEAILNREILVRHSILVKNVFSKLNIKIVLEHCSPYAN